MTATALPSATSGFCGIDAHHRCPGGWKTWTCDCACHTAPEPVTVHCFFHCGRAETSTDPVIAHEAMEQHYFDAHREQIRAAIGWAS